LYSEYSTWSSNILLDRMIAGNDDHLFNLNFEINEENSKSSNLRAKCKYNSLLLIGHLQVKLDPVSRAAVLEKSSGVELGGCFKPESCEALQKVAILIPYKDREENLLTMLSYLHPMLQRQEISYCVFVVEQFDDGRFNKGLLMNSGFLEIQKTFGHFDCFVFHDVDMIPEDDRNIFLCQENPVHLSPSVSHWAGVTMIKPDQFLEANGYSNMFWGWGFENSDMEFRLNEKGLPPIRPVTEESARYSMIVHDHPWRFQGDWNDVGSISGEITAKDKLRLAKKERASWDGVKNTKYKLDRIESDELYTKIFVDVSLFKVEDLQIIIEKEVLKISQKKGTCSFKTYDHTFLDPKYFIRLQKHKAFYDEETARAKCIEAGQICAGITRLRNAGGKDWYMREKAVLVTPDKFRFKNEVPDFIQSQVKICEGERSTIFPLDSSVKNAVYKSKLRLKFHHAIETSVIYRDIVVFEGKPTGITHKYSLNLKPEDTKTGYLFFFEAEDILLPENTPCGWYTVRAMITDRFEQIFYEWSFQFHLDNDSPSSTSKRLEYLEQIEQKLKKYKETSEEIRWSTEEKLQVRKDYSHGRNL